MARTTLDEDNGKAERSVGLGVQVSRMPPKARSIASWPSETQGGGRRPLVACGLV